MARRTFIVALMVLTLGALALRIPHISNRPFHGDEAVHAFKFRDLWLKGEYVYDPNEYHGPTLYYAALPSVLLSGHRDFASTTEADFRLPIAIVGGLMVLLFAGLAGAIGRRPALWAALLTTISPAFVFYSRYYIQEILLAFFTLGMLVCGWQYVRARQWAWLAGAGAFAGLMIASKETAILTFVAAALAIALTSVWTRRADGRLLDLRSRWNARAAASAVAVALAVACFFLSGFLSHPSGPLDYLRAYTLWLHRAGGTEMHRHPFGYYLHILAWWRTGHGPVWSEGIILALAVVGAVAALRGSAVGRTEGSVAAARFFTFFTLVLTVLYSAIPYKTPWCVLSFLLGMIVLAGIGADVLVGLMRGAGRKAIVILLLAGCAQLKFQAYRASFVAFADPANPYTYAQPGPDAARLGDRIVELTRAYPARDNTVIKVFSVDNYYWPLPWYLRRFPNIGYWNTVPPDPSAPIVLASPEFDAALSAKLNDTHIMNGYASIRTGVFLEVWVRMDVWQTYLAHRKKPADE